MKSVIRILFFKESWYLLFWGETIPYHGESQQKILNTRELLTWKLDYVNCSCFCLFLIACDFIHVRTFDTMTQSFVSLSDNLSWNNVESYQMKSCMMRKSMWSHCRKVPSIAPPNFYNRYPNTFFLLFPLFDIHSMIFLGGEGHLYFCYVISTVFLNSHWPWNALN